jgi:hypothetical protein
MATKVITDLDPATTSNDTDVVHMKQVSIDNVDRKLSMDLIAKFVTQDSTNYGTNVQAISADDDLGILKKDQKLFIDATSGDLTLGLFNGASRDGLVVIVQVVSSSNGVGVELVSSGISDVFLSPGDTLIVIWNDTDSQWEIIRTDESPYDLVISSQSAFNFAIERVSANLYKIKDQYVSMFLKSGDYACSGSSSFLSGGDTWGVLQTNNCRLIEGESGSAFDFIDSKGYLEVNSVHGLLKNLNLKGDDTAADIQRGIHVTDSRVTIFNCKVINRKSNYTGISSGFSCSTTTIARTAKFINCTVRNCNASGSSITHFAGFYQCYNLVNCQSTEMGSAATTASFILTGFYQCKQLSDCTTYLLEQSGIAATKVIGFEDCERLNNCIAESLNYSGGGTPIVNIYGYRNCVGLSNCTGHTILNTGGSTSSEASIFIDCQVLTSCYVKDYTTTSTFLINIFDNCRSLSACHVENITFVASVDVAAFNSCWGISGCTVNEIEVSSTNDIKAYTGCKQIAGCRVLNVDNLSSGNAYGFNICEYISGCSSSFISSTSGTAEGIKDCDYIAATFTNEPINSGNDFVDTADAGAVIATDFSCNDNWT